jgi:hypothetical protein
VNSAAVNFIPKPWFEKPGPSYERRMITKRKELAMQKGIADYKLLLEQEKLLGIVSYKNKRQ